ncbi:MAG: hemerythrin family protein [Deltaproteobacteria bacterium]|nr:hemerythrin family protein [Deltaproteobacteria bacterium]
MPLIMWTPDLAVGVPKFDDQHKQLFKAADDLAEAMWEGKGTDEVMKTIDFMVEYTAFHFNDEEATMTKIGYPEYAGHKQSHVRFVSEVDDLKKKYQAGELSSGLAIEVLTKACNWFREHIRLTDKALGDYIQEKGLSA